MWALRCLVSLTLLVGCIAQNRLKCWIVTLYMCEFVHLKKWPNGTRSKIKFPISEWDISDYSGLYQFNSVCMWMNVWMYASQILRNFSTTLFIFGTSYWYMGSLGCIWAFFISFISKLMSSDIFYKSSLDAVQSI